MAKILYVVSPVYDGIKHIKRRIEASYEVFFSLISFYRCFVCAPSKLQLLYIYLMLFWIYSFWGNVAMIANILFMTILDWTSIKPAPNQYLNSTLNIWIHRISDITSKRISIKPLSAGRYLLISCYKVQCFYDMFAKICFTWFCLFFVEVANSSFWGSNIGKCVFNLWQSERRKIVAGSSV